MWEQIIEDAPRFFGPWNLMFLGQALVNTLLLSYIGAALGFAIGFALAIGRHPRLYGMTPVRILATTYVELFRRIPMRSASSSPSIARSA
jgi:polar amino acid transport system permease protein